MVIGTKMILAPPIFLDFVSRKLALKILRRRGAHAAWPGAGTIGGGA
jgi:hypothetical protein